MEESRDRFVISHVSTRALPVSEPNDAATNEVPIISTQGRDVKRMNQTRERRVTLLAEQHRSFLDHGSVVGDVLLTRPIL
jgi:hypothetical protein